MAERDFSAKLAGKFVDDDDFVRTGRAWVEIDGFDFLHIPVPKGFEDTLDVFETQADQIAKDAEASGKYASAAKSSASAAAASARKAAESEGRVSSNIQKAQDGATRAETAASNAKQSESSAASSASSARSASSATASTAKQARDFLYRAESAKDSAASSESAAKGHADRAANIASSTSWSGDRLTVNGKTSPSLTGPRGADGTVAFDALTEAQKAQLKGEVTKSQLDTAIASERARTVGMVWMVETEDAAKTKESSCQKGDFIQVAATGNIYQVV